MEQTISILILFILSIFIVINEVRRSKIDALFVFSLFYFGAFVFVPAHIILWRSIFTPSHYMQPSGDPILAVLAIAVFYIVVVIVYDSIPKLEPKFEPKVSKRFTVISAAILITISSISMIVYMLQFDSMIVPIRDAALIRAGSVTGGSLVFTKTLVPFSFLAFLLIYSLFLREGASSRVILFGSITILLSLLAFTLLSGRRYIIDVILVISITILYRSERIRFKKIALLSGIALSVLVFGNAFFSALFIGPERFLTELSEISLFGIYVSLIQIFSHIYISIELAIQQDSILYRGVLDYILGLFHLLPERVLGIAPPDTVLDAHTNKMVGENGSTTPPGIVAFAWYSGGWIGIIIHGMLLGTLFKFIDEIFFTNRDNPTVLIIYVSLTIIIAYFFIRNGSPRLVYRGMITWILFIISVTIFYYIYSKVNN